MPKGYTSHVSVHVHEHNTSHVFMNVYIVFEVQSPLVSCPGTHVPFAQVVALPGNKSHLEHGAHGSSCLVAPLSHERCHLPHESVDNDHIPSHL